MIVAHLPPHTGRIPPRMPYAPWRHATPVVGFQHAGMRYRMLATSTARQGHAVVVVRWWLASGAGVNLGYGEA